MPKAEIIFDHHASEAHDERLIQIRDFYDARQSLKNAAIMKQKKAKDVSLSGTVYHPLPVQDLYLREKSWAEHTGDALALSPFGAPDETEQGARKGRDFADIRALPDGDVFAELRKHLASLSQKTMIACYSEGSKSRMEGLMENAGIPMRDLELIILPLEHGFVAPDLAVITEQDILGDRLARKTKKKRKADNFL
ncbi:MAG: hypothetical protein OIF54_00865, partial [Cohaesibacter sp.]|nr:hypothetical protein [Cohaesibacter sp.]